MTDGSDSTTTLKRPPMVAVVLAWGAGLVILGFVLLIAAVHESLYDAAAAPYGGVVRTAADGLSYPDANEGPVLAWLAVVSLAAGAFRLIAALLELGRRSDVAVGARPRTAFEEPPAARATPVAGTPPPSGDT